MKLRDGGEARDVRLVVIVVVAVTSLVGCYASHGRPDAGNPPPDTTVPDDPPDTSTPPDTHVVVVTPVDADVDVAVDVVEDPPAEALECETPRAVDLLFVVDDSGSINDYRAAMHTAIYDAVHGLVHPPDRDGDGVEDWPRARDLHLGVTTTSITGGGVCPGAPDGVLSRGEASTDPACEGPFPSFVSHTEEREDADRVAHQFACMVGGVAPGCMIEQPLEAALKALLPSETSVEFIEGTARGDTDNAGFLRDDSLLVIVFVTDEDDCSIQDPAELAPDDAGTGPIRPGHDAGPPHIDICDDTEELFPIDRYIDAFSTLRARRDIVIGVISGWPTHFTGGNLASAFGGAPSGCADSGGWTAAPTRLIELGGRFPRGFAGSICEIPDRAVSDGLSQMVADTACR